MPRLKEYIRVNLAGEYGAVRIYKGQIDALKRCNASPELLRCLRDMHSQEVEHLEFFKSALNQFEVRPTILHPIWHFASYTLGYVTGRMGEKSAMACTVAVEEVIDEHYASQLSEMPSNKNLEMREAISKFREDELEHRDIALKLDAQKAPLYKCITAAVKSMSRLAILLSRRF